MYFPQNMLIGSIISIIYCFIFWKWESPGHLKDIAYKYSVFAQVSFWIFYLAIIFYIRSNQQNIGLNILYTGVLIFYFIQYLPFFARIFYRLFKMIQPLKDYSKTTRYIVLGILLLLLIAIFIAGMYLFVLFFYGFAP